MQKFYVPLVFLGYFVTALGEEPMVDLNDPENYQCDNPQSMNDALNACAVVPEGMTQVSCMAQKLRENPSCHLKGSVPTPAPVPQLEAHPLPTPVPAPQLEPQPLPTPVPESQGMGEPAMLRGNTDRPRMMQQEDVIFLAPSPEETAAKLKAEAEAARRAVEAAEAQRKAEAEAARRAAEAVEAQRKAAEEAARQLAQAQAAEAKRKAEAEEAARRAAEAVEAQRKAAEEAARQLAQAQAAEASRKAEAEEAARRAAAEAETKRQAAEEAARQAAEAKHKAEEATAAKIKAEAEAQRRPAAPPVALPVAPEIAPPKPTLIPTPPAVSAPAPIQKAQVAQKFVTALLAGDLTAVQKTLKQDSSVVNIQDDKGNTPLSQASKGLKVEVVRFLLDAGANVNLANGEGVTPLMAVLNTLSHKDASKTLKRGNALVEILLHKGAEVNQGTRREGKTALMVAAERGLYDSLEIMFKKDVKINIDQGDNWGNTALIYAIRGDAPVSVVRLLRQRGANMALKNNDGQTPVTIARSLERRDILAELERK